MRPKISVFLALSLDGYLAGQDDDLSWLEPYSTDSPAQTGYEQLLDSVDVMVIGRNTYDIVLPFDPWPYAGKRVIVLSSRALAQVYGEEVWNQGLELLLQKLGREGCRHVYLDGGNAVRQGLALDAVDEITLSWVPVILGKGIPLFGPGLPEQNWVLQNSRALPSGLLQAHYKRR